MEKRTALEPEELLADLFKEEALGEFIELHHREPTEQELKHLELTKVEDFKNQITHQGDVFQDASILIYQKLPSKISAEEMEQVRNELFHAEVEFCSMPLAEEETDKESLSNRYGISEKSATEFYQLANDLFLDGLYKEAATLYEFLILVNPYIKEYWLAQGLALKKQNLFKEALVPLHVVYFFDASSLMSRFHVIESHIALKDWDEAQKELTDFKPLIENSDNPMWQEIFTNLSQKIQER